MSSIFVNAPPEEWNAAKLNKSGKYLGNHVGIVIQNNDPDKSGKVKVWVPHLSPTVYKNW